MMLEDAAREWIAPYWNAEHLERTLHWALELRPDAGAALRLAALTHDAERMVPGGPRADPAAWDDPVYLRAHGERSAEVVDAWLAGRGEDAELRRATTELIVAHELGGWPEADVLQAADSLSFLEVNGPLARSWVASGRCTEEQAEEKLRWMCERVRLPEARATARRLLAVAA